MSIHYCLKSSIEAEAEASEVDSFIAQGEVTVVIQKLLGGQVQGGQRSTWSTSCLWAVLAETPLHRHEAVKDSASGLADLFRKGGPESCSRLPENSSNS